MHSVPGLRRWIDCRDLGQVFEHEAPLPTPRSYRDRKDYAMEAARLIKSKNPHSMVSSAGVNLRPTGLGSGIDMDCPDDTVVTGEWEVGRIYETSGGLRWFWSMTVRDACKAWASLEETE